MAIKRRKKIAMISIVIVLIFMITAGIWLKPSLQTVSVGDTLDMEAFLPSYLANYITLKETTTEYNWRESLQRPGEVDFSLRLFGMIPVKQVHIAVVPQIKVYPGGQPVGILMRTRGILVVGMAPTVKENGKKESPAQEAGIQLGDVITKINGEDIANDEEMAEIINTLGEKGKPIALTVVRDEEEETIPVQAKYCCQSKTWRLGLYIRDNAGGIGTLSFITEEGYYGALGHMVSDNNTGNQLNIIGGKLVKANIEGIKRGEKGLPGEKIGSFVDNVALGSIESNTYAGIYGQIVDWQIVQNNIQTEPIEVAFYPEIKIGPAKILTAIDHQKVEEFDIEIVKIMPKGKNGKNMVIHVTDERLLEKTGGIIQGMSGSPILQNGKIVGAVTHVLVNNPKRGYGIFIENMLKETDIFLPTEEVE